MISVGVIAFCALSLCPSFALSAAKKEKNSARTGDLLFTVASIESPETVPNPLGHRPQQAMAGHRFVVVRVRVRNLGKSAACAEFIPRLKTDFGLEYRHELILEGEPPRVSELLPGEGTEGSYIFEVKDGVTPRELVMEPRGKQGWRSSGSSLPYVGEVRISLEGVPMITPGVTPNAPGTTTAGNPAQDANLVLEVTVTDRAWVAVDADGKTVLQGVLNPGDVQTLKAHRSFDVTTGNAEAVTLTLNGELLRPLGRHGEVKTVHLTRDDLKGR
jgi:hypothetical protein